MSIKINNPRIFYGFTGGGTINKYLVHLAVGNGSNGKNPRRCRNGKMM
jgi:hypothetical protein